MKKTELKYEPMVGGVLNKTTAVIAGNELHRISEKFGCITPEKVVAESRPAKAPLHDQFTWDDGEAAELWRCAEAGKIIRSVRVVRVEMPEQEQPIIRAFLSVTASDTEKEFEGTAYIPLAKVQASTDYMQQVLNNAKGELQTWTRKYSDYKQYFDPKMRSALEAAEAAIR